MAIFNFIYLSCKKATFLISKKEEGKLTPLEKIQLKLHLNICDFCTRFEKQTKFFSRNSIHLHDHSGDKLSDQKKQEIQSLLKD
jgi:hypothetical protein